MEKCLIIFVIAAALMMPMAGSSTTKSTQTVIEDFTHTVFVEHATLTFNYNCVNVSSRLYDIYNSGDLDFCYVTLIADWGFNLPPTIKDRLDELNNEVAPTVYFDGAYSHMIGERTEQEYRDKITQAGMRLTPDIDIDASFEWLGGGTIKISVEVQNNELEDYDGRLRVYVVEKESRWLDNGSNPYHYAALDIPVDENLALMGCQVRPLGDTYTFTRLWDGSSYGFGDITQDNVMVTAVLFDRVTGDAVQAASALATNGDVISSHQSTPGSITVNNPSNI